MTMKAGEVARIWARAPYGPGGFPAWGILPNSDLIFDITLLRSADTEAELLR